MGSWYYLNYVPSHRDNGMEKGNQEDVLDLRNFKRHKRHK